MIQNTRNFRPSGTAREQGEGKSVKTNTRKKARNSTGRWGGYTEAGSFSTEPGVGYPTGSVDVAPASSLARGGEGRAGSAGPGEGDLAVECALVG
jgi:hypothetical protein